MRIGVVAARGPLRMRTLSSRHSGCNDAALRDPVAWDKRCSSSEGGGAPIHPWLP